MCSYGLKCTYTVNFHYERSWYFTIYKIRKVFKLVRKRGSITLGS